MIRALWRAAANGPGCGGWSRSGPLLLASRNTVTGAGSRDLAYLGRLIAANQAILADRSAGRGARGSAPWWRAQWRRAGRAANDELGLEEQFLRVDRDALHLVDQQGDRGLAHRLDGLADGGQRRVRAGEATRR